MKYIFSLLILFIIITQTVSAASDSDCETKKWFDLYTCRVKTVCEPQEFNSKKPLYQTEKYENAENFKGVGWINQEAFKNAQKVYKSNMSNIYKCAVISSQKVALKKVKDMLKIEKTGTLDDEMGRDLDLKIQKNELSSSSIWCKNPDDKIIYNKLNVLNETTFELCKYTTYLEYLKIYYGEISNLIEPNPNASPEQVESYPNSYVSSEVFGIIQKSIQNRKEHIQLQEQYSKHIVSMKTI
jgi:hypothetical protein